MKLRTCLLMFVVIGLMFPAITVTADDAVAASTYDYKVSSNLVLDSGGSTVYTAASFTAALNWALSHVNTKTYVPAGTYTLTAHVYFATGTTLFGDGDATVFTATASRFFYINGVSDVTLSSFKFTGHLQVYGYKAGGTCGDWTFTDVHATQLTGDMESGFWIYVGTNGIINGITFTRCTVTYSQTYGFLLFGDDNSYSGNSLIKNVAFTDCDASHNGGDNIGWINAWITGYDLVECTTVENIVLTRCTATYNWCSGFHVEYGAKPKNIVLIDCVTSYNGQKPNCEQYYGYGFKFQNFQVPGVTCTNLVGTGNHEGFTPISMTASSLNMKTWVNTVSGRASSGSWYPAGAPGASTDLIFTKLGSNANCMIDTYYRSVKLLYYYGGTITYATPSSGTVSTAPTNLASTLTSGKVALTWSAPASNGGSAITSYNVYRGTSAGGESATAIGTSTSLAYTDSNVVAGTTYYYVVKAVNSVGTSAASNEASRLIPGTVPSAPTNLASTLSAGKVSLTWNVPASNGGSAISLYNIYRGTAAGSESATALGTSTSLAYTDSNVVAGTTYYYVVKAVNSVGTSAASNEASRSVPSTVPSAPTNLAATLMTGKVSLTWSAPASNGGSAITSYNIYRGTSAGSESTTALGTSTILSYIDSNIVAGMTYFYIVKAVNSVGTSMPSNEASDSIPSTVPSAPTNLAATLTAGKIALTWTSPSANGGSPTTSYNIYRGTSAGTESSTALGTSVTLSYIDSNVVAGMTYYYVVKAVNSVGTSSASNEVSSSIPNTVPSAPTNLVAALATGKITLTWSTPASSGSSPLTGYVIYRGTSSALTGQVSIGTSTATSYVDAMTLKGTYYYTVKAVSSVGSSPASTSISVVVGASSTAPGMVTGLSAMATGSSGVIKLTWTAPSNGGSAITGYKIYRGWSSGFETLVKTISPGTSYTDTWMTNGVTYYYRVAAVNAIGNGALSEEVYATPTKSTSSVPGTVTGLSAISTGSSGVIKLTWSAPSNGGSAITGYNIYRSWSPGTETLVKTISPGTSYTDTWMTNGVTYYYRVAAVNAIGTGAMSAEVRATPHM